MELRREGQVSSRRSSAPELVRGPLAGVLARARRGPIGAALADDWGPAEIAALRAAGVAVLHAALHAVDPLAHDFLAAAPGSFHATLRALRAARAERLPVALTTLLARSNTRILAALPGLLADLGVAAWRIAAMSGGEGQSPRLSVALPFALQALVAAERLGIPAVIEGAPHCLLGPLRGRGVGPPRVHPPPCADCPARGACPGVAADYLRFADEELSPRRLLPPAPSPACRACEGRWFAVDEEGACSQE